MENVCVGDEDGGGGKVRQGRRAGPVIAPPTGGKRKGTPPTVLQEGGRAAEMLSSAIRQLGCWVGAGPAPPSVRAEERGEREGGEAEEALTTLRL